MRPSRSVLRRAGFALLLALAACKGTESDAVLVRISNSGTQPLTDVKVWSSEADPVAVASLAPGASTGYVRAHLTHYWFASARSSGTTLRFFSSLDPPAVEVPLDPGRYTVFVAPDLVHNTLHANLVHD